MPVPGPAALGRSVITLAGAAIPAAWAGSAVVGVDESVWRDPAPTVGRLHRAWAEREPVVIALAIDPATFREPVGAVVEPWTLEPDAEPWLDRLHHLVWANAYDARSGEVVWWWGRKASRLGAVETVDGPADVSLADGSPAWIDGGPRRPFDPGELGGAVLVHSESVDARSLAAVPPPTESAAELAPDQRLAVGHLAGPARVIAPAGSGKTRVLTERLRHLLTDRRYERGNVLAVAYNKQAQLEMQGRCADLNPRVRTLNSLGLWILNEHRPRAPTVIEEREVRRLVDRLAPVKRQRRANTDPIGPYVECLSLSRLGLRDPAEVEASRDDVPGFAELFGRFREALAEQGVVDFDEQVYGAVELLWADGPFRRSMQAQCRHLLVDEFQDLTPAHILLLRLLALPGLDVFGVGDDDQVIYQHAGADPAFLVEFATLFPGAAAHPLTVNYRCPVRVVEGARTLLGYNHRRVPKEIHAGPAADAAPEALDVVVHEPDNGARALLEVVQGWLSDEQVRPESIAVLTRVNSLLLAPHLALQQAGVPVRSMLGAEVLERTGLRAALAYVRIGTSPTDIAPADVVEILRRPTRGLPQWFPDRLHRRGSWTASSLRAVAGTVPEKEADKVHRLVDDLELVTGAAKSGTTRQLLLAVRDEVGLGQAMGLLDQTGTGQGSSHLDDLEGLLQVADLHPEPATFEDWLRRTFQRQASDDGVTLSTIHRVKGREWDRVAVFGVSAGLMPHRLADDVEEERRVLHVAMTRARHRVALLTDASRRSPFLDELAGTAPKRPAGAPADTPERPRPMSGAKARSSVAGSVPDGIVAAPGLAVKVTGGYEGTVLDLVARGVTVQIDGGGSLSVKFGERVEVAGRRGPLAPPDPLWGEPAAVEATLRSWRTSRAKRDGVPAYVVLNDRHLRGIAMARPSTLAELAACDGIGPTKLENYGDEILELVAEHAD